MNGHADKVPLTTQELANVVETAHDVSYGSTNDIDVHDGTSSDLCSAKGTISFQGIMRKSLADFIHLHKDHIENEDGSFKSQELDAIYKLMTGDGEDEWNIHTPNLIVSVTGGAKNFDIDDEVLTVFKDILRKISQTPGAWVITGGTHAGVMKHVGDALREEPNAICLGIPTFGVIDERKSLLKRRKSRKSIKRKKEVYRMHSYHVGSWLKARGCYLDPNHTHFLLYDNNVEGKFGGEIKFRAEFEDHVAKKMRIPYILVVLNGGPGTFQQIYETIGHGHKVILMKGSGGMADFVASKIEGSSGDQSLIQKLVEAFKDKEDDYHAMISKIIESKKLFVFAAMDGDQSINDVVIEALLSTDSSAGKIETSEYLRLALLWQNPQVLIKTVPINKPENVVSEKETLDSSDRKKIWFGDIENLLVMALARGDVQFVRLLLLDYEVDINGLLTKEILQMLYGYQSYEKNFKIMNHQINRDDYEGIEKLNPSDKILADYIYHYNQNKEYDNGNNCLLKIDALYKLRRKCFKDFDDDLKTVTKNEKNILSDPLWELFLWSVVCNLPQMAKTLWSLEGDQMAKALIASHFWGERSEGDINTEQEIESFRENKVTFNNLACSLLDECYKRDENNTINLITRTLQHAPDESCLSLAVEFTNIKFVAHTCVQKVLCDVWTGEVKQNEMTTTASYLWFLLGIFLPCFVGGMFEYHKPDENAEERKGKCGIMCVCCPRMRQFYGAPVVSFLLHLMFNLGFVVLYSYLLIAEGVHPIFTPADYVLYIMGLGHLTTELYQISQYEEKAIGGKLKSWIADLYSINFWDAVILTLFLVAFILHLIPSTVALSHTIHSVNCALWILRVTTALRVHPMFGQYYEMVKLMLKDLSSFLLGLLFLILAYGVFSTSMLYPEGKNKLPERPFLFIFMRPLFHIYGEFFMELRQGNDTDTSFETDRNKEADEYLVWVIMGIYLCITNIIILNIIIAVFNNTYNDVMAKGKDLWKFNRYHFIVEYVKRLPWPPPFCILAHLLLFFRWIVRKLMKCWKKMLKCCKKEKTKETIVRHQSYERRDSDDLDERPIIQKKNLLNTDLKRDLFTFEEADKVRLSQYESDRARYIFKNHIEFVDDEVIVRGLDNLTLSTSSGGMSDGQWEMGQMLSKFEDTVKDGKRVIRDLGEFMEKIDRKRLQQERSFSVPGL